MLLDYARIAVRNLTRRRLRSWLTMLGIVVGIASVIALIGLGNGLRAAITGQFGSISADVLTIQAGGLGFAGPPGSGVVKPLKQEYEEDIAKIPGVRLSVGRLLESANVDFNEMRNIELVVSMPEDPARREIEGMLGLEASDGRLLKDGDKYKVVLGSNFGKEDNSYGRAILAGDRVKIKGRDFEVVGIMKSLGSFLIDNAIIMNEDVMREIFDNKETSDIIMVQVKSLDEIDKVKAEIEKYLRKERDVEEGEEDFSVESAQAVVGAVNNVLGGVQAFVIIIASISMIVGAIGIINTMFTAVLERRKEIGIMKSIGARNRDIFTLFLVESGLLGTIGGIMGILTGTLFAVAGTKGINSFLGTDVAPQISILLIIAAVIGSFMLGAGSGIVPAMQASQMNPIDSLRH